MFISIIPQNHCRIIERFGKPVRVQKSGIVFRIPILEQVQHRNTDKWGNVCNKGGGIIELTEQIVDTIEQGYITKDNAKVRASCVLRWRVLDPIKAVYEIDNLLASLKISMLNAVRSEIGSLILDNLLSAREALTEKIIAELSSTTARWGVKIISVDITEFQTDTATGKAMLQQMDAERKSRAIASEAEGEAKAITLKAEAEANAAIFRAQGVAEALRIISEAEKGYLNSITETIGQDNAARVLLAQKTLEGFSVISSKPGDKVYIPSTMSGIIALSDSAK